jgi:hypothetical protein
MLESTTSPLPGKTASRQNLGYTHTLRPPPRPLRGRIRRPGTCKPGRCHPGAASSPSVLLVAEKVWETQPPPRPHSIRAGEKDRSSSTPLSSPSRQFRAESHDLAGARKEACRSARPLHALQLDALEKWEKSQGGGATRMLGLIRGPPGAGSCPPACPAAPRTLGIGAPLAVRPGGLGLAREGIAGAVGPCAQGGVLVGDGAGRWAGRAAREHQSRERPAGLLGRWCPGARDRAPGRNAGAAACSPARACRNSAPDISAP